MNENLVEDRTFGLKDVDTIIWENRNKKNSKNLNTNFPLYKKNALEYIAYLENMLAHPEEYPYSDKNVARIKSIISSQTKRIHEFEKKINRNSNIKTFTTKRNQRLEGLLSVLDETLNESMKVKLMKRMRNEIHDESDFEDEAQNFDLLTRKILL